MRIDSIACTKMSWLILLFPAVFQLSFIYYDESIELIAWHRGYKCVFVFNMYHAYKCKMQQLLAF